MVGMVAVLQTQNVILCFLVKLIQIFKIIGMKQLLEIHLLIEDLFSQQAPLL
jgi:hypothetical protein